MVDASGEGRATWWHNVLKYLYYIEPFPCDGVTLILTVSLVKYLLTILPLDVRAECSVFIKTAFELLLYCLYPLLKNDKPTLYVFFNKSFILH